MSVASPWLIAAIVGAGAAAAVAAGLLAAAWRRERARARALGHVAGVERARLQTISDLAAVLSDARTRAEVAAAVVEHGMRAAGADTCTLHALDEAGTALELVGHRGVAPEMVEAVRRITPASNERAFADMKAGKVAWAEDEEEYAAHYPALMAMKTRKAKAFWSVPLLAEDRPVGLLGAGFSEPRAFPEDERAFVATLAHQCAQALLRASRLEREAAHERRDRARSEFLSRAGEALVSSIDYEPTLATVARLAVPTIADWCAVNLVDGAGSALRRAAFAHVDPGMMRMARELDERFPPDPDAFVGVGRVVRTGQSQLVPEIPEALVAAALPDEGRRAAVRRLGLESLMVVPLRARGRTFGALTFAYAGSGRRYTPDDLAFAEDFARRAAMAIENASALEKAEAASRSKDDFLATVSHELRTPLNSILGWAVTLRRRGAPEEVDRALAIIERNARAQAKLIEDVLDLSRITSGKLSLVMGPTDVAGVVAAAIENVAPAADAKGVRLDWEVEGGSLTIAADADRLQQVVWNVLSNAVKFTPKGGRAAVRAYREGSDVCIHVTDTGEGIRPEVLPIVFEPFQQADGSTTRAHGGLGLGLAIAKKLVTAHGGSVSASSEGPGKGATFVVRLPARAAVPAVSPARAPSAAPAARPERRPMLDGLRLLVVDDEPDALALVAEVLRDHGAEVRAAASAAGALEEFAAARPDVVVSDIGMPGMDGYSLIRRIRALPPDEGGRTPAVALTAYARSEDAQRAFVAGYQMHVAKPVEPAKLATIVANLGGRSLIEG